MPPLLAWAPLLVGVIVVVLALPEPTLVVLPLTLVEVPPVVADAPVPELVDELFFVFPDATVLPLA